MQKPKLLHVGGLAAVGFSGDSSYLLTISHSGRGVFSTATWERLARDAGLAYPLDGYGIGIGIGIGPLQSQRIRVLELDSEHEIVVKSPNGAIELHCTSSHIAIMTDRQDFNTS